MQMIPYIGIALVLVGALVAAIYTQRRAIRISGRGWDELVAKLEPIDEPGLRVVALDYLDPQEHQTRLQPEELWTLIGGEQGLQRMRANADLMLALAAHAQAWNFEEAMIVGERMRRDSLRLRKATSRVEWALLRHRMLQRFTVSAPFYVQEAAGAYFLMRQRLLALCLTSHAGRYTELAAAL